MGLNEEIKARRAEIKSDGYAMSIGELLNLYRDGELDIHPEFQRFYRWTEEQKSKLIESILLGIPLPSIFVSQLEDGTWDVVDGLQRLSTIFQLAGVLKGEDGIDAPALVLSKTKYLPSLAGKKWEDEEPDHAIGAANQLLIRRAKIDVKIILWESSKSSKYELFQRLNSGGSQLSDQELRNVMLIMTNRDAYRWIADLARDENFQTCVALSDRALSEQYHLELVTRFLVFRKLGHEALRDIGDIGEFLNDEVIKLAEPEHFSTIRTTEEQAFKFTFAKLAETLAEHCCHRYDTNRGKYVGGFLISAFEAIAIGLGFHHERFVGGASVPDVELVSQSLWRDQTFQKHSESGVRASSRIPSIIPLGRQLFAA